ncbi:MAG TPA: nitronate monooxygenase [Bdellovibrionota bacterium]|nr:nitronate monooxygenase [Bdellovibrionota bacterium]
MISTLSTPLCRTLGIDWPIILGPLGGGPSTPELVAEVSNAGAFGFLGAAYMPPDDLERALVRLRSLTSRPFGVNLFVPAADPALSQAQIDAALAATCPYRAELGLADPVVRPPFHERFDAQFVKILEARPRVFSFTFGLLDRALLEECRSRGIQTMGTATTLEEAQALEASGVDAVVAQGAEAGGHRGLFSPDQEDLLIGTLELTRAASSRLRIPVIAAGGIMNGKDIAAVLAQGAQAAQLGTAFLLCPEAGTSAPYREALKSGRETRLTRAFSGRWARGLPNRFMTEMESHRESLLPYPAQNSFTREIRKEAARAGRSEFLSLWAGEGVSRIREMKARELVETLKKEATHS